MKQKKQLTRLFQAHSPPAAGNPQSVLCIYELDISSLSDLFHLAQYPRGPFMLLQIPRFRFLMAE